MANGSGYVNFWQGLSASSQEALRNVSREQHFAPEQFIFAQDDPPDKLFILMNGFVKVVTYGENGYQAVLGLRGPGDIVGDMAVIDESRRSAGVFTLDDVMALAIPTPSFLAILRQRNDVSVILQRCLNDRLRESDRYRAAGASSAGGRLAALLLDLALRHGSEVGDGHILISLPISQDDLAGMLSISRRTVARTIETLREQKIVVTGRKTILIKDVARLSALKV